MLHEQYKGVNTEVYRARTGRFTVKCGVTNSAEGRSGNKICFLGLMIMVLLVADGMEINLIHELSK
jgi:hypothetical protein